MLLLDTDRKPEEKGFTTNKSLRLDAVDAYIFNLQTQSNKDISLKSCTCAVVCNLFNRFKFWGHYLAVLF